MHTIGCSRVNKNLVGATGEHCEKFNYSPLVKCKVVNLTTFLIKLIIID